MQKIWVYIGRSVKADSSGQARANESLRYKKGKKMILIKELDNEKLEDFFQYLAAHISENGQNGPALYFPISKEQSILSHELMTKFKEGISKKMGEVGWRKAWIAFNQEGKVVGHIDIRPHNQLNSEHRVLLGMGVDIHFRNLKIGQKLLAFIIEYCRNNPKISWIDLDVMTNNVPAKNLYEKMNFEHVSTTKDMFRIDNISYDYTSMTLYVGN
ncbi:MAG: GNAT family N-acetyltransferase [Bacteroidia bacterium]|nr:GNAT family N-acetyltransferase [Bacteroidia bacterium]